MANPPSPIFAVLSAAMTMNMSAASNRDCRHWDSRYAYPPNVILVFTDDSCFGDLSCYGNRFCKMPNTDKLHDESVRLNNCHVSSVRTPSHDQLLTGIHAMHTMAFLVGTDATIYARTFPRCPKYSERMATEQMFSANGISKTTIQCARETAAPPRVKGWFYGSDGKPIGSAYYVTFRRK